MKTITYNPETHRLVPVEPNNTALDWVDPGFGTRKEAWERILASFPQPEPVESEGTELNLVEPVAIATYVGYRTNDGDVCKRVEIKRLKYIPEHTLLYTAPPDYEEIKRQRDELAKALEMLVKESREVADDHHRPRYARLDGAILSAINALASVKGKES